MFPLEFDKMVGRAMGLSGKEGSSKERGKR